MPWRKHLSPEERGYLEKILRQDLVPVHPDPEFVRRTFGHLQDPREMQIPLRGPRSVQQSVLLFASLSGALLGLALSVLWVFFLRRQGRARDSSAPL